MILNSSSKVICIQSIGISEKDADKIYIPRRILAEEQRLSLDKLVMVNDEIYYIKYDNIINELIGSFLAKKINLYSVDYQIGIFNNKDYEYFYPNDYSKFKINPSSIICQNPITYMYCFKSKLKQFDCNLIDELLKLIALDLKMGQLDRSGSNLMIKKNIKTEVVDFAPIYDYSNSYFTILPFEYYINVYLFIRNNNCSLKRLTKKFPQIMEYIDILKNIDMEEILKSIEKEKNVELEYDEKEYRLTLDKEYTKLLKEI
ncbi:MAG: hypothetical protein HFI87_04445 [Bacilli bacterium]|nr:hypothetical protein [Bacilli bacterium]